MNTIKIGVALIVRNKEGKVLIAKSPKIKSGWTLPGGHMELGEKIIDTAKREAEEEVGLGVDDVETIRINEAIEKKENGKVFHMISFHAICISDSDDLKIDKKEIAEAKWVDSSEALDLVEFEDFKKSLEIYKQKYE